LCGSINVRGMDGSFDGNNRQSAERFHPGTQPGASRWTSEGFRHGDARRIASGGIAGGIRAPFGASRRQSVPVEGLRPGGENLAALAEPLDRIVDESRMQEIPGVGGAIADIVIKLHRTGTHPSLEKLREEVPKGVLEMLSIPGRRTFSHQYL
jgi:hypothetical protein